MATNDHQEPPEGAASAAPLLARNGGLSYLEIPAIDIRQSAAFYGKVLGWQSRDEEASSAKFADLTGHLIGRWVTGRPISRDAGLLAFFYVDRLDRSVGEVPAHGGAVVKAPYAEGTLRVAIVRDPAGNILGLWQESGR
jgi:predicted enzyme related to lactoylglutathione lyase